MRIRLYTAVAIAFGLICFVAYVGLAWATWVLWLLVQGAYLPAIIIAIVGLTALIIAWQGVSGVLAWGER